MTTTVLDGAVAAHVAAAPPVVVLVGACGGAGVTTTAALLSAALASAAPTVLVGAGTNRGSTAVRAGADGGGDVEALSDWVRQPSGPLTSQTPGIAVAGCGPVPFLVGAGPRDRRGLVLSSHDAVGLVEIARRGSPSAVVVDWGGGDVPAALLEAATHLVVVAPSRTPGLLAAEYTVEQLVQSRPAARALSLLTVDVIGRTRGRAGRAAVARLRALHVPTVSVPFDPTLSTDPIARWASLRPRTRSAAVAALTHLLQGKDLT